MYGSIALFLEVVFIIFLAINIDDNESSFYYVILILLTMLGIILLVLAMTVTFLFYTHIKFVLKESGTLQNLKDEDDLYNYGKIANLNFLFGNIWYFLIPLDKVDNFEGHYFYKRGRDPEYQNQKI